MTAVISRAFSAHSLAAPPADSTGLTLRGAGQGVVRPSVRHGATYLPIARVYSTALWTAAVATLAACQKNISAYNSCDVVWENSLLSMRLHSLSHSRMKLKTVNDNDNTVPGPFQTSRPYRASLTGSTADFSSSGGMSSPPAAQPSFSFRIARLTSSMQTVLWINV